MKIKFTEFLDFTGAFWGVLGLSIIVVSCFILYHITKRRHRALVQQIEWQRQQAEEQRQRADLEQGNASQKPVSIPIVVVLPNDEVAFGWEVPSSREESFEERLDSVDSIKLEKDECDILKNDTDMTRSSSSSSSSPV